MKLVITLAALTLATTAASAQFNARNNSYGASGYGTGSNPQSHYVQPHTAPNGSFYGGHFRSNPNPTELDNFGTRGNLNPFTGTTGTRAHRW